MRQSTSVEFQVGYSKSLKTQHGGGPKGGTYGMDRKANNVLAKCSAPFARTDEPVVRNDRGAPAPTFADQNRLSSASRLEVGRL